MHLRSSGLVLSPSDLSAFLSCRHRTGLDLAVAHGDLEPPEWRDAMGEALRARGEAHEQRYLHWLRAQGLEVLDLSDDADALREARTLDALRRGVHVVYQAVLAADRWRGYADILRRVEAPSALGNWSYEVHDTKLARETRGGTILQLSAYSDLLTHVQSAAPQHFHVVTPPIETAEPGDGAPFSVHTHRVADFGAYYRRVRRALDATLARGHASIVDAHYPEPVEACELCRWHARCHGRRRRDDHLSFIAGIGRPHRAELVARGVPTLSAAAALPVPLPFHPTRGSVETFERLRDQAAVQVRQRERRAPVHELLPVEPALGLARLPEPSDADVFLDLEGARFAREGGREYLFGLWTRGAYHAWWAHSDAEERMAFEAVVDLILAAWEAHPGLHVYHFGHYEVSAFKRLMGRHATRADALDRLLRGERFIDLHTVTRQALRAGVESYSIKQLEQFYGFERDVRLDDAASHLRAIELALEGGAPGSIPAIAREAVRGYNRDDCRSTQALRDWLEALRAGVESDGTAVPRPVPKEDAAPPQVSQLEAQEEAAAARLLDGLAADAVAPTHPDHPRWLLAFLTGWHRREDKAQWWERYRLNELSEDDLAEERAAIVGMAFVERASEVLHATTGRPTGSVVDRYRYLQQETEVGRSGELLVNGPTKWGEIQAHDRLARVIDVKKSRSMSDVHPTVVFQADVVRADVLRRSLLRQCTDVDAPSCGMDLLFRRSPRLMSGTLARAADESTVAHATRVATHLDAATLAVQGPPGAGKTYIGAQMIRALVAQGKSVGVVAVSHKVIRNLLDAVDTQAAAAGEVVRLGHKNGEGEPPNEDAPEPRVRGFDDNAGPREALRAREVDVLGGTAWMWAREEFAGSVDVLVVDEAGQMSLANALAVAPAARSLVLLGDPQQLDQPQKASHPDGVDVSALQHMLGDASTMPGGHGLFLSETWRLAPEVCGFTSELFYEGKLRSHDGLEHQRLTGTGTMDGAGLWWCPVEHEGNRTWSAEEIDVVDALVDRLLAPGMQWVDADGVARQLEGRDVLVVAPYNAHVNRLADRVTARGVRVGTVDKFQGQEAPVVIYAMAASSAEDAPRGLEFLLSLNRLNVATSRARCAAILVASPRLLEVECRTPAQMRRVNALCRYVERARLLI